MMLTVLQTRRYVLQGLPCNALFTHSDITFKWCLQSCRLATIDMGQKIGRGWDVPFFLG